ncbi:MAG: hypothetical protein JNL43_05440 [Flavobacteriales bacterium]|nr:hypothetical protein [Flavobacteriales bacterium]HRH68254.1 hypothetical protein [Flavobacteriales bacterium]
MRTLLPLALFLSALAPAANAQQTIYEESRVPYKRELIGGILIHGDGWGLQFYHAKYRTARDRRLLGVEVVGMKHPKEVKSFNPYYEDSRGYFYGKQNALLIVRPTYGRKWQITDKIRRSGAEVNFIWSVGPSLGLLKPVYLQIGKPDRIPYENIVVERYDPAVHDVQNIYGRATWFNGVNEMKLYPGGFARLALNFEYSGQVTGVKGIEVGATIDAYGTVVPIMAELEDVTNKQFFFEFYLALQFGKKLTQ